MSPELPTRPERWRRIAAILDQTLDLPSGERGAFLDRACAGDPALRTEVEALLAADEQAGRFLARPAAERAADLITLEPEDEEPPAGRQVGPYRLLRVLGRGAMGTVYEAEDTRLGRRVAVKLLPPESSHDRRAQERFLREARAASALDHPNLCTVYDVGESDGGLYIVLALYEGETLKERLRRGPLPVDEAREIAVRMARGLTRAHEAGIIHRDIKPANVMLTRRGEVKILDFGIAKLRGDDASLTRTGAAFGTPAYMSPEQARGAPVDGRTDVWALGVVLFEMLAGRRPFEGEGIEAVLAAVLTGEPAPLRQLRPGVPPELARTVSRALAKEPAGRYPGAAEMLADLEPGTVPAATTADGADGADGRRPRARRWRTGLGAAAAALAVTLLAVLLARFPPPWTRPPAVRVAVLRPAVTAVEGTAEPAFIASDVVEAIVATLVALDGLQPLDPPPDDESSGSPAERRRAGEADEALLPHLECHADWCRVTLRRLRAPGGVVLATVGPFEVQAGLENAQRLAEGVQVHLLEIYPDRPLRAAARGGGTKPRDYAEYTALERRVDRGERLGTAELARLDGLLRSSPGLLGAYRLAADVARGLGDVDRALAYLARAEELAPHDPRTLFARVRAEMAGNRLEEAQATLARLAALAPGDARVQSAEADLLERRGELDEARRLRQEVARRRPTWRPILELATLEVRMGASDSARRRLAALLAAQPDNQYVRENLAALEAGFGDLRRAAALYEELIALRPARPHLTNLGFVRFLLGDAAAAAAAYRRALLLEPGHLLTRFNLAAALEARGERAAARPLYRALAQELEAAPAPDARLRMLHAQCLARLGRRDEALRLAEEVLAPVPEDVQILHQAAQLYALLGERLAALYYTERTLRKGLRREWFTIPEFASLAGDPDFLRLLARGGGP